MAWRMRSEALAGLICALAAVTASATDGVSDWAARASALQRFLAYNSVELNAVTWVATHNSYSFDGNPSTHSSFEVVTNQIYNVTTQLNCFGVRGLEFDPRWVDALDKAKVCHVGDAEASEQYNTCESISWTLCNACGIENYGPDDTGCSANAPDFVSALEEVAEWLDANPDEVLFVKLDSHLEAKASAASDAIKSVFGTKMVYKPSDFDATYPTIEAMLAAGQRITFFGREASDLVFLLEEDIKSPQDLRSEECGGALQANATFGRVQGGANVINVTVAGQTIYSKPADPSNFLDGTLAAEAMACGLSPTFDRLNASLAQSIIWSWASDYPDVTATGERCAYMSSADGRWRERDCSGGTVQLLHACRAETDRTDWVITTSAAAFDDANGGCPQGYVFGAPQTAAENAALVAAAKAADDAAAWINYKSGSSSYCWVHEAGTERCAPKSAPAGCGALTPPTTATSDTCDIVTASLGGNANYTAPGYSPNGVVRDLHGWPRVAGSNEWQVTDATYLRGIALTLVPFAVVALLVSLAVLPLFYWALGKRPVTPARDAPSKLDRLGGGWGVAFAVAVAVAAAGAVVALAGLGVAIRHADTSVNQASGFADQLILSDTMAEALESQLAGATGLAVVVKSCPVAASSMTKVELTTTEARSYLNEFLQANLGGIGHDIQDGLDTAGSPKARLAAGFVVAILALVVSVCYAWLFFAVQRAKYAAAVAPKDRVEHVRTVEVLKRASRGSRRAICVMFWVGLLIVALSWLLWGLATAAGLYSSDFCIAPSENLVTAVGKGQTNTVSYYTTCEGSLPAMDKFVAGYADALVAQGLTNDLLSNDTALASCSSTQVKSLQNLAITLDTAVKEGASLYDVVECSNINPYWVKGAEQSACTDATAGLAAVIAGFAVTAVMLGAAILAFRPAAAQAATAGAALTLASMRRDAGMEASAYKPGDAVILGDDSVTQSPMAHGTATKPGSPHQYAR